MESTKNEAIKDVQDKVDKLKETEEVVKEKESNNADDAKENEATADKVTELKNAVAVEDPPESQNAVEEAESQEFHSAMEVVESQEVSIAEVSTEKQNETENQEQTPMEVDQVSVSKEVEKESQLEKESESEKEKTSSKETEIEDNEKGKPQIESDNSKNTQVPEREEEKSGNTDKEVSKRTEDLSNEEIDKSEDKEGSSVNEDTKKSTNKESDSTENDNTNAKEQSPENSLPQCIDVDMETEQEKEASNDASKETEKPEFVQITQDKEDSQLENQLEAEDPFANDNLCIITDEVSMEVDSATRLENSKNTEQQQATEVDEESVKTSEKDDTSNDKNNEEESNKEITKSAQEKAGKSNVQALPGQDDELCIIPDSTKEKTNQKRELGKKQKLEKGKEKEKKITKQKENEKEKKAEKEVNTETKAREVSNLSKQSEKRTTKVVTEINKDGESSTITILTTESNDIEVNSEKSDDTSFLTSELIIDLDDDAKNSEVEEISSKEICKQCKGEKTCLIKVKVGIKTYNVCSEACKNAFTVANNKATDIPSEGVNSKKEKRCANCLLLVDSKDEKNLSWETMEFCNEECLGKFQTKYGSYCRNCNGAVQSVSLGKYCVRFGYDVRQFCCSTCLEEFKKGLKVCSYCQKDISAGTEGFLAPVGDKGQFKNFCTQDCMEKYSKMNSTKPPAPEIKLCDVCQKEKVMYCQVQIDKNPSVAICSEPCFAAFKFVNKVDPDQCSTCKKYFQLPKKRGFVVFHEDEAHMFCNKTCLNVFIISNRKIIPCNWCKVKKYNFDMIKKELKNGQVMMMCSLNCLTLYQVSINAVSARRINCDFCKDYSQAQYHLTMSDATIRNFCSYKCVMNFQSQYTNAPITIPTNDTSANSATTSDPVPTGIPKRADGPIAVPITIQTTTTGVDHSMQIASKKSLPVISSVTSLAGIANGKPQSTVQLTNTSQTLTPSIQPITIQSSPAQVIYKQQVVTRPTSPIEVGNKMTQCAPKMHTKGVSVRPIPKNQSTQTENIEKLVIPIPVPIYVPFPIHMYSMPFPVPVPIPLPIPVPVFIPTTRNSAKGIFKEIKRIQEKIPSDPFEAELLMMAEMVATEKKNESDSDSNDDAREDAEDGTNADSYSPEGVDSSNAFGDDMLQMALKMATGELDEAAVDLETALTPNTIQTPQHSQNVDSVADAQSERSQSTRGRKRGSTCKIRGLPSKRGRRAGGDNDIGVLAHPDSQTPAHARFTEPVEKPDANLALKYTFGVNAWRQWVITKNAELEKQSTPARKLKLFKTDLLQLTADELNYSLCLFVNEVRKPNGTEYAPDIIYYLCLGIQQYLFENNRIDNIFTDAYYEKFTDCLNEVAKKFTTLCNAMFVVTRVEEEHLWECKQLGAHSPHVLLNTLMYFNTKHFNLVSVDEHMQLSFSHIMKHWKRNQPSQAIAGAAKVPGSRSVLLRFYPPQSTLEANSKKKKVYEQQANEDNPLRCPVKLYEFYLSKCPESVKTRNDVFYLLPERSCVPDSPVWYSTSPLAKDQLIKMLHRIKMVKEINVALLSS